MKNHSRLIGLTVFVVFVILVMLPAQTHAAPTIQEEDSPLADKTWVRLGGPLGGIGYDIKTDPENPDVMFVTDAFSGIHKSIDGGKTWFPINKGIDISFGDSGDSIPVFCVTIDPNDSNIVWIGLQNTGALYQSLDGGETWTKKVNGIVEKEGFTVRGISVEPGNSNIIYAAGEIGSQLWAGKNINFQGFDTVKGVVYKSTDGGEKWIPVWRGDNLARYIIIDPNNTKVLYISTGIFDRLAANSDPRNDVPGGAGIIKSEDGGVTWRPINNGLKNLYVGSLYMHPQDSNILLAGTGHAFFQKDGGIFKTENGGLDWVYVGGGDRVVSVEISTKNTQIAYAGDVAHSNFYRSQDGGTTWQTVVRENGEGWGPDGIFPGWPIDLQVDPRNPMRVFVNNYGGGNFLSEDGGNSWVVSSIGYTGAQIFDLAVDADNPATVYTTGESGAFRSIDGGITWDGLGQDLFPGVLIFQNPEYPDTIFFGRGGLMLLHRSIDQGKNWDVVMNYESELQALKNLGTGANLQGVSIMSIAPSDPNTMYAGVSQKWCFKFGDACDVHTIFSIAKSSNRGETWSPISTTPFNGFSVTGIVIHPERSDTVYVATAGAGIFKTSDGGTTWEKINSTSDLNFTWSLKAGAASPNMLLAGTNRGIFISQDGGISWNNSSSGMDPNERIRDIVVDPIRKNVFYSGSARSGVYVSENFGQKWQHINNSLTNKSIFTLSISSDGETLYAGTIGEGVFRLSIHDQSYFDSLAPTPTAIPPTVIPKSIATKTPVATSIPIITSTPTTTPIVTTESSKSPFYIVAVIVLLLGLVLFVQWKRKSKG